MTTDERNFALQRRREIEKAAGELYRQIDELHREHRELTRQLDEHANDKDTRDSG